jgi:phosphomethylpyrimidine synthase
MKITQEVREYAASLNVQVEEAVEAGMAEMSGEFKAAGSQIYVHSKS